MYTQIITTYATASVKMRIGGDGLKELTVKENATYNASDADESLTLSLQNNFNSKFYLLFEAEGNTTIKADVLRWLLEQMAA